NFVSLKGTLTGEAFIPGFPGQATPLYTLSTTSFGGMSGGPVVNSDGKVFSLNTHSNPHSASSIKLESIRQVATAIPERKTQAEWEPLPTLAEKRSIEIWKLPDNQCPPCKMLSGDLKDPAFKGLIEKSYNIEPYDATYPKYA